METRFNPKEINDEKSLIVETEEVHHRRSFANLPKNDLIAMKNGDVLMADTCIVFKVTKDKETNEILDIKTEISSIGNKVIPRKDYDKIYASKGVDVKKVHECYKKIHKGV